MLSDPLVVIAALLWLGLLFGAAVWAERHPHRLEPYWSYIYSLSLAVYCTSWTFYGTVTQAQRSGWPVPPTFIGTILLYAFGFGVLRRLYRIAREQNSTSLADLVATRLGKHSGLAASITFVAVLGIIPYIALQLKAVTMSYGLLTNASQNALSPWQDSSLYVALAMAVFAMLFGTRRASLAEHNRGLVMAMAVESLLKLGAMLSLGVFVWIGLDLPEVPAPVHAAGGASGFPALILLGALAMLTLPHQFHVGVVECRDERHLRTARWLFPLYMLLIALPILPLARAGDALLAPLGVPSDLYVLALPLSQGHEGLALVAFLGGLSAATGMVILATLALSVMIGNHWLTPMLVRGPWAPGGGNEGGDLRGAVLMQRRVGILAVVLFSWAYSRAIADNDALADIGAVSFSGLATLAPAVAFAVWRPRTPPRSVILGLVVAVLVWTWALLVPALADALDAHAAWLSQGPWHLQWLAPDHLFGLGDWSRLGRAVTLSLLAGTLLTWLDAARRGNRTDSAAGAGFPRERLQEIATRFLPEERVRSLLADAGESEAVPGPIEQRIERELASVLGAASARLLLDAARREQGPDLDTVATIVGEASQALRFNQRVLEAALQNMSQGISVVDGELRLVAWNRRYVELFDYPEALLRVGVPVADLLAHNLLKSSPHDAYAAREVDKRLSHMRAGTPYVAERRFGDSVVEIRGNPMPGGGFVATFTDVTAFRRTEAELKGIAETLEMRVIARTAELEGAKGEAERANRAKTRFLAAVSHDLAQPLNAAHLFTHALAQQLAHPQYRDAVNNIDGALGSAENLLAGLLDISRLDAGGMAPNVKAFCIDDILQHLATEFGVLARHKRLQLHYVPSLAWVRSDPQLLRRALQNFLANAVRYTGSGRILLGCRRQGDCLWVEVHDTGPGIAESDQQLIFEEFRRLDRGGQGLGLGLAIAERITRLLGHRLLLRSRPGQGAMFAIRVPRAAALPASAALVQPVTQSTPRSCVLVVENDAEVLRAMVALLSGWQCEVLAAHDVTEAERLVAKRIPDMLLLDYHLDAGRTGLELRERLAPLMSARPCVIITADHSEAVRAEVFAAGCQLLYKPLKPLALKSVMARFLAARESA